MIKGTVGTFFWRPLGGLIIKAERCAKTLGGSHSPPADLPIFDDGAGNGQMTRNKWVGKCLEEVRTSQVRIRKFHRLD